MENQETSLEHSKTVQKAPTKNTEPGYGDYAFQPSDIVADDPAAFFIFCLVQVSHISRVSELKSYFSSSPEMFSYVDAVLNRLEDAGIVRVKGDEISSLKEFIDFGGNAEQLKRFLPNLFRISINRVLENEIKNPAKRKEQREMARWFALPNSPEIAKEARKIDLEYKAKMIALQENALRKDLFIDGVRFVGIVNCVMDPEDFG